VQDRQNRLAGAGDAAFYDLVPAIWLPTPELRRERERSGWRLHLVKHRSTLKNRVHSTLITFGHQVPMADLFGPGAAGCSESSTSPSRGAVTSTPAWS
jgi:hypothetical protein